MGVASVRSATAADAELLARLQLEMFATHPAYLEQLPTEVRDRPRADQVAAWGQRLDDGGPVWIAAEGGHPVGLAAAAARSAGASGPGEIELLLVLPRWGRRGHGGRLLATVSDWLRATGAVRGEIWALSGDRAAESFLTGAGWHPGGTARVLDTGSGLVTEIRYGGGLDLLLV